MLKICLVFWESEPQYAYKRYAYKKHVYEDKLQPQISALLIRHLCLFRTLTSLKTNTSNNQGIWCRSIIRMPFIKLWLLLLCVKSVIYLEHFFTYIVCFFGGIFKISGTTKGMNMKFLPDISIYKEAQNKKKSDKTDDFWKCNFWAC